MRTSKLNHILIVSVLLTVLIFISCTDQGDDITASENPPPSGNVLSWEDVSPIFQNNCVSCHGGNGGLFLDTYAHALEGGDLGAVIIPGDADNSLLYQVLNGPSQGIPQMPLDGSPLSNNNKNTIRDWINDGALEEPPE